MTHLRNRYIYQVLKKKLAFSKVVSIQGARQTGKSFLAREIFANQVKTAKYITFDRQSERDFASTNSESFLSQYTDFHPLIIDEAQKVPHIFDAIKYCVDSVKKPGQFLLLGSTEFSHMTRIRESLTGRLSKIRLFPFTLAESLRLPARNSSLPFNLNQSFRVNREDTMRYLRNGGMPGIFAVRSEPERESLLQDWINLTVERDIHVFPKKRLDADLALKILTAVANLDEPDISNISKKIKQSPRRIISHIDALLALFVLNKMDPHPMGTGKTRYFLCDVAFAHALGASFERRLNTWILNEQLVYRSVHEEQDSNLYYYRTAKGSIIHFVEESTKSKSVSAMKLLDSESVDERELQVLRVFSQKIDRPVKLFALGASQQKREGIDLLPWEALG